MIQNQSIVFPITIRALDLNMDPNYDLNGILRIEQETPHGQAQWDRNDFASFIHPNACIMLADSCGLIVGFAVCECHNAVFDILNFAVMKSYWRRKIGTRLMASIIAIARQNNLTEIRMRVREQNLGAQLFLGEQLFVCLPNTILRSYYPDTNEDAYRFVYPILDKVLPKNRLRQFMK